MSKIDNDEMCKELHKAVMKRYDELDGEAADMLAYLSITLVRILESSGVSEEGFDQTLDFLRDQFKDLRG